MVILFGISWPISIFRSFRARTAKGKSLIFLTFIWLGYLFGILSKILGNSVSYVFVFYIINICMVSLDIAIYFRNSRLDSKNKKNEKKNPQEEIR